MVLVGGALAQHRHARADAAVEERDHPAHVVGDDLDPRVAVEQPREHQPRHRDRGLVGPAEAPPHLEARALLGLVVRHVRGARRVHPDRQIVFRHRVEQGLELGLVERPSADIGEDLDAACAEVADRPVQLVHRPVHVVHRERGDEGDEPVRVKTDQLRHRVVGDPCELRPRGRVGNVLERRVGKRNHLPVLAELVHQPEADVEVVDHLHLLHPLADVLEPRRGFRHVAVEIAGKDVGVDVDRHVLPPIPGPQRATVARLLGRSGSRTILPSSRTWLRMSSHSSWRMRLLPRKCGIT